MPEGPFNFRRRLVDSKLIFRADYNPEIPFERDIEFTNNYLEALSAVADRLPGDTDFEIFTESLPRSEHKAGPLGTVIDERGVALIETTNPSSITINRLNSLQDNLNSIVFDSLDRAGLDTNVLVRADITLIGGASGIVGVDRPFVQSDLVLIADYTSSPEITTFEERSKVEQDLRQELIDKLDGVGRPDFKFIDGGETIKVNLRHDRMDATRRTFIRAMFRDTGRDYGVGLNDVTIAADGDVF